MMLPQYFCSIIMRQCKSITGVFFPFPQIPFSPRSPSLHFFFILTYLCSSIPQVSLENTEEKRRVHKILALGAPLVVQWLALSAFTAAGPGSIPGLGTKIPRAAQCGAGSWLLNSSIKPKNEGQTTVTSTLEKIRPV